MEADSVIVVGTGPVGLVTALGLAQAGVAVHVLEAERGMATDAREPIYHWSTLAEFDRLGVLHDCITAGLRNHTWSFHVRRTGERIAFRLETLADEIPYPFNLHLRQSSMTAILLKHLALHRNATVEWGTEVSHVAQDADGVTVVAEGAGGVQTYRAGWVVGADGARSIVRRQLGLAFAGMTWPERFVVTDLRFDFADLGFDTAGYQVDPAYGAVVATDDSGAWRYIFAESRSLPEEDLSDRVQEVLATVLPTGADPQVQSSLPYRIHQRSVDRFRVGRVLLVGDAAHLTNPTSGLGMTSGLFDAFAVIEALTAVVHRERGVDLLDRYSEVRHRNFWEFTSPVSSEVKEFVFSAADDQLAEQVAELRSTAAHPALHRAYVRAGAGCATPSLLGPVSRTTADWRPS